MNRVSRSDVLVAVATVGLLATLLVATLGKARPKADRGQCRTRLLWMGTGLAQYYGDHANRLPWQTLPEEGGSSAYVAVPGAVFQHYVCARDYFDAPSLLLCPQDARTRAESWKDLRDSNLSYFLNLTTEWTKPRSVVAGDRYLTANSGIIQGVLELGPQSRLRWAKKYHNHAGNLLFADGSVAFSRSNLAAQFFLDGTWATQRLSIP